MTLADLLTTLQTRAVLPVNRVKDLQTSLRYLATALGHPSPAACPVDAATLDVGAWLHALETHFDALTTHGRTISASTRRNTRNNLRVLLRLAEAQGLLAAPLPVPLLTPPRRMAFSRAQRKAAPYQSVYHSTHGPLRYGLPKSAWPPDILVGWQTYTARCPLGLRQTTLQGYTDRLTLYFGYILRVVGRPPTWDDCFDLAQLHAFVRWHAARVARPLSCVGEQVVVTAATIAQVLAHPHAQALADLRKTLPTRTPLHNKRLHWVSLAQLEAVAEACVHEGRKPVRRSIPAKFPRQNQAGKFQKGVILKLLVRVPLRQRNVRELRLDDHLYQDGAGHWQLHLKGSDLKIGTRGGRENEYRVDLSDYCPDFIPVLEEFLTDHRPMMQAAATLPYLFLTRYGNPFGQRSLKAELTDVVAMYTGQRFYPHLIRSIWATEYLEQTQDFTTAAVLLGDTLKVVMETYYDVVHKNHHAQGQGLSRRCPEEGVTGAGWAQPPGYGYLPFVGHHEPSGNFAGQ